VTSNILDVCFSQVLKYFESKQEFTSYLKIVLFYFVKYVGDIAFTLKYEIDSLLTCFYVCVLDFGRSLILFFSVTICSCEV